MKKYIIILFAIGFYAGAGAQGIYNNGAYIVNDGNGSYWVVDDGGFTLTSNSASSPTEFDNLKIMDDASLNIDATSSPSYLTLSGDLTIVSGGSLTVESTANGTASLIVEGSATGNVTTQRYIAAASWSTWDDGWHMLASPVVDQNISTEFVDITATPISSDVDFFRWSESEGLWINIKDNDGNYNQGELETNFSNSATPTFGTGEGYLVAYSTNQTKNFTGELTTASVAKNSLSYTSEASYLGSHLLGNPYPCALKWNQTTGGSGWNLSHLFGTAKIWNESNASYTDIPAGGVIPPMQGFVVNVTADGSGSLNIYEGDRAHSTTAWYKDEEINKIKLIAHDIQGEKAQESVIRFNANATENIDIDYDSYFMAGYAPMMYTKAEDKALSTNTLPELTEELSIPLYFVKNGSEEFYIEAEGVENLDPNYPVYLTDQKTGITQKLSDQPVYTFTSEEEDDPARFLIHFKSVGIEENIGRSNFTLWNKENTLHILNPNSKTGHIQIFNMLGQSIMQVEMTSDTHLEYKLEVDKGYYVLRIIGDDFVENAKIYVE